MKVSIRQALTNVASNKYDKKNIFLYFIVLFIINILGFFAPEELSNTEVLQKMNIQELVALFTSPEVLRIIIASLILAIICNGCIIIATHNAIHNKEGIYPNIFKEIGRCLWKSISYIIGSTIIITIITALSTELSNILLPINFWFFVLIVPIIILLVHAWLCLNFRFYMTLKFKDWFSFKKSWIMIQKNIRRFGSYIGKTLALLLFLISTIITVIFILGFIIGLVSLMPQANIDTTTNAVEFIGRVIQAAIGTFISAYIIDLTAQLLSPIVKEEQQAILETEQTVEIQE